jgi:hypothetical protein
LERAEVITTTAARGKSAIPDCRAVCPSTVWKYWLRKKLAPKRLNMIMVRAKLAPVKDIFLKRYMGSMAFFALPSQRAKAARKTMESTNVSSIRGSVQPFTPAWMTA